MIGKLTLWALVGIACLLVLAVDSLLHAGHPAKPLATDPPIPDFTAPAPEYVGRHRSVSDDDTRPIYWAAEAELIRPIHTGDYPALPRRGA